MSIFSAISRAVRSLIGKTVQAKYDAAQTNADNRRHWANADGLSADASMSPAVRTTTRNRSRYENANNGYMKGINNTHAIFTLGTGPRLQMLTGIADVNAKIEKGFKAWAKEVRLAKKLRVMRKTKLESGEAFAIITTNSKLKHPVKLDIRLIEADRVRGETQNILDPLNVDGIQFDEEGNPVSYSVMRCHPGGLANIAAAWKFDTILAKDMIHLFDWDRPEQSRGMPELTASLPLFAQLRRFTLATVTAAETAANHAGVLQTTSPGNDNGSAEVEPDATYQIERNMLTALPEGWVLSQMKAEHPTTTYPDFKGEIINETARPINMPKNIATGNSSGYNYASGRLDHQVYFKSIDVERDDFEIECLDRILEAWLQEAVLISGYLPQAARGIGFEFEHQWFWDGMGHVDPVKDATAQEIRIRNRTATLAEEYAKEGRDWEAAIRQIAKEQKLMKELGISPERPEMFENIDPNAAPVGRKVPQPVKKDDDEGDDDE